MELIHWISFKVFNKHRQFVMCQCLAHMATFFPSFPLDHLSWKMLLLSLASSLQRCLQTSFYQELGNAIVTFILLYWINEKERENYSNLKMRRKSFEFRTRGQEVVKSQNNLKEIRNTLKTIPVNLLKILLSLMPEMWSYCLKW